MTTPAEGFDQVSVASGMSANAWLLIAIPLVSAVLLLIGGRRLDRIGHWIGCAAVIASFVVGVMTFLQVTALAEGNRVLDRTLYSWIPVGSLQVDFGTRIDPLSLTFVLLITGVGSLIHIYSIGYMSHDPDRRKFFAYLNLFVRPCCCWFWATRS